MFCFCFNASDISLLPTLYRFDIQISKLQKQYSIKLFNRHCSFFAIIINVLDSERRSD